MTTLAPDHGDLHHRIARARGVVLAVIPLNGWWGRRSMRVALAGRSGLTVIGVEAAVEQALTGQFEVFNLQGLLLCRDGRYHGPLAVAPVSAGIRAGLAALLAQPAQEPP